MSTLDGQERVKPRPTEAHAAVVKRPDSVTHFICPARVDWAGSGTHAIDASGKCAYCKATRSALANLYGVL